MAKKTDIVYVIPRPEIGGAEKQLLRLIEHLDTTQYRTTVICLDGPGSLLSQFERSADDVIVLQSENRKEKLQLMEQHILYIRAEDNYVAIAHMTPDGVKEVLLRSTLVSLERLLKDRGIIRCHRSFLVNRSNIQRLHTRSGEHVLELKGSTSTLPVSRSCLAVVRQSIKPIQA